MTARISADGSAGTWSWSLLISDRYGSGKMSARELNSWASLTKVGPSRARRAVSRSARR